MSKHFKNIMIKILNYIIKRYIYVILKFNIKPKMLFFHADFEQEIGCCACEMTTYERSKNGFN